MAKKPCFDFMKEKNTYNLLALGLLQFNFQEKLANFIDNKDVVWLGRVVVYENILSYKLAYLIGARERMINDFLKDNKNKIKPKHPQDLLKENKTFGDLITIFEGLYYKETPLIIKLKEFNKKRNKLTHFMHLGYPDIDKVLKDAQDVCDISRELVRLFQEEEEVCSKDFKLEIPSVISSDELMKMESDKKTSKYGEPEDVDGNLEKYKKLAD